MSDEEFDDEEIEETDEGSSMEAPTEQSMMDSRKFFYRVMILISFAK